MITQKTPFMATPDIILRELKPKFTRQDVLKLIVPNGYSVSYANAILETLTHSGKVQRTAKGKYRKRDTR